MHSKKFFGMLLVLVLILTFVSAADYQCVFKNQGQVNCNVAGSADTYCTLAGPGSVANNPAKAVSCTNNSPGNAGTIVCKLSGYTGNASSVHCSNNSYLVSGPSQVAVSVDGSVGTGASSGCSYNACALNQVGCASAYAYEQCVPDPTSPGCNKWQALNCLGNASCYSSTAAQLATCIGIPATQITSQGGVYFRTTSTSNNASDSTSTQDYATAYVSNGKTYYIVRSDDPNGDTGTKACQRVDKKCVGYTATNASLCSSFYPDAKVVTNSVNGSRSPYYCDGPPQTDLACQGTYNTCAVCPACNVNADCDTQIGQQFRAMFVECAEASASGDISGVLSAFGILGNSKVNVIDDGASPAAHYGVTVKDSKVASVENTDLTSPNYTVEVKASASAAIKSSADPSTEAISQFKKGNILVTAHGFAETVQLFIFNIFTLFH